MTPVYGRVRNLLGLPKDSQALHLQRDTGKFTLTYD